MQPTTDTHKLTASSLAQLQASIVPDNNHATNIIRQEQAQAYERAAHDFLGGPDDVVTAILDSACENMLDHIVHMYGGEKPSSALPMERACFAAACNEPFSGLQAAEDSASIRGSFEHMVERVAAAEAIAQSMGIGNTQ